MGEAEVKKKRPYKKRKRKICPICNLSKPVDDYYASASVFHKDGYCPYCKDCVKAKAFNPETNTVDEANFKAILRQIDKPFITSVFNMAVREYNKRYFGKEVPVDNRKNIVAIYFKDIQTLRQYKSLTWESGLKVNAQELGQILDTSQMAKMVEEEYKWNVTNLQNTERSEVDTSDFVITPEMRRRFGDGYTAVQYKNMNEKYNFLAKSYATLTNLHEEALITYVRYKVMEENAIRNGDVNEAEKWGRLANNAANQAKLSPNQLTASDLQGGVNSFSEFFAAIEQAQDIIEILPKYKTTPQDSADFIILCYVNYLRKLEGKPEVKYRDLWAFYDERKKEYKEVKDSSTVKNRQRVENFLIPVDDDE